MWKGFNLKLEGFENLDQYETIGKSLYTANKNQAMKGLEEYTTKNGRINGTEMKKDWFPEIMADIFISHSHSDEKIAVALSGYLHDNFGLNTFIDSCVWGYANDLLFEIDKKNCSSGDNLFSYEARNYSTSNVHMMLATAISKMMDKTECVFFLNTQNSITTNVALISQTESPWIYFELAMTKILRANIPNRLKEETRTMSESLNKKSTFVYELDLSDLIEISFTHLLRWERENKLTAASALDKLYEITNSNGIIRG